MDEDEEVGGMFFAVLVVTSWGILGGIGKIILGLKKISILLIVSSILKNFHLLSVFPSSNHALFPQYRMTCLV